MAIIGTTSSEKQCLLAHFSDPLALTIVEDVSDDIIQIEGKTFTSKEQVEFVGFYDWLRTDSGLIVGVRHWPFDFARYVFEYVADKPYADISEDGSSFSILFLKHQRINEENSDDQMFTKNRIFHSDSEHLMTFSMDPFTEDDLQLLCSAERRF